MVCKDGNTWGPDAWPDLVTEHFVDFFKAPEVEIMAEKPELEILSCAAGDYGKDKQAGKI